MTEKNTVPVRKETKALASPLTFLQREIDRLFDDFSNGFSAFGSHALAPKVNVSETDKVLEITAELPGLEEKDVEVNFADNVFTIRGEKKAEKEEKDKNYRLIERSYGTFSRSMELPNGIDPNAIKASISKGVLTVTVQKPAAQIAKKIEVKAAA